MVKQINDALHDHGEYTIEAKDESGTLTINTLRKGADIELKFEDVGTPAGSALQLSTLGLDAASLATGTNTTKGTTVPSADTGAEIIVGSTSADTINLSIESLTTSKLGIADLNVSSEEGAAKALSVLDLAIDRISNARAELGATMSRFEFRSAQIDTSVENLKAAESAIRDVDIAKEQAQLSASTVKVQAAVAAASQANEMPQNLLSLIR
ncbi:flagellin [Cohaesibacter sp. ES.047]|uniref:flagellin n=1 Tax=Cohaesibacter sp. ES.047 TaxID=1798205 RepID=UPI00352A701A